MRRLRSRRHEERGVAIVETAVVLPFLVLLVLGIWEFSAGWQANLNVQATVRAAARTGSSLGNDRAADYSILQAAKAGLTKFSTSDIQRVVVFKASDPNGTIPAACVTGASSTSLACNVYTGSQVNTLTLASFTGTTDCTGAPDAAWCPINRNVSQATPDYVGVYIRVLSRYQTGFFPGTGITIEKTMVMRLEPKVVS
ncbi:MAG: pilus assembly protein [Acidimicrobiia bacterium]|nr:pilus assembly protein [Acidimicrobiia bacterium]